MNTRALSLEELLAEAQQAVEDKKERMRTNAKKFYYDKGGYAYVKEKANSEARKKAQKKHYQENKEASHAKNRTYRLNNKLRGIEYLGGKCCDCQNEYPSCVYDFHHRDPTTKEFDGNAFTTKSWENVKKELDKCDLLCANCHRIRHSKQAKT